MDIKLKFLNLKVIPKADIILLLLNFLEITVKLMIESVIFYRVELLLQ